MRAGGGDAQRRGGAAGDAREVAQGGEAARTAGAKVGASVPAGGAGVPGLLQRCIELGARQVQAQVYSSEVDGMLEDARSLLPKFDAGQLVAIPTETVYGLAANAADDAAVAAIRSP